MIRIWIKDDIKRIQISRGGEFSCARFTSDLTIYDYRGNPEIIQACLEFWKPPKNKYIITEEQLQSSEWLS